MPTQLFLLFLPTAALGGKLTGLEGSDLVAEDSVPWQAEAYWPRPLLASLLPLPGLLHSWPRMTFLEIGMNFVTFVLFGRIVVILKRAIGRRSGV